MPPTPDTGPAAHGLPPPAGQAAPEGPGRFTRMFPDLHPGPVGDVMVDTCVGLIEDAPLASSANHRIPSGYTYLAQFVDHDITFDPTSKLGRANDPATLENFRTPRFDLDSVYGAGPADQPYLYEAGRRGDRGVKLLIGRADDRALAREDLPRNAQGVALVGDPRNDENLIIAQLHLLLLRFHNRVVDLLRQADAPLAGAELFAAARRVVTWHYQWIVVHDLLDRLVGPAPAAAARHRAAAAPVTGPPAVPVEFSGAAYRVGHSMVRDDYTVGRDMPPVPIMPDPGRRAGLHLRGFRPLPAELVLDWDLFVFAPVPPPHDACNHSLRIDHRLSRRLRHVPPSGGDLARLNLERGQALGLPSGPAVAGALGEPALTAAELRAGGLDTAAAAAVCEHAPLWFYVLCEAGSTRGDGGQRLGPVGGHIVAEVLCGLLAADPAAFLRAEPGWLPELPRAAAADFTLADLIHFTTD